jgi:hypothetical protein
MVIPNTAHRTYRLLLWRYRTPDLRRMTVSRSSRIASSFGGGSGERWAITGDSRPGDVRRVGRIGVGLGNDRAQVVGGFVQMSRFDGIARSKGLGLVHDLRQHQQKNLLCWWSARMDSRSKPCAYTKVRDWRWSGSSSDPTLF